MLLKDRKKLARLIEIQGVSQRAVARAAGWRAHSYMQRLLDGSAKYVDIEPAVRIATFLGVDVSDLFLLKTTSDAGQIGKQKIRRSKAAA